MVELVWDGKYDKDGRRVAPPRITLPFQTVETVNESAADRDRNLDMFGGAREPEWRNRLIWGDKKYVLPSLLPEFAGKVDLIYIDPPFATGGDFSFTATVPDDPNADGGRSTTFVKQPSVIEQKAYRDTWGRGLDSYLKWFYEAALLLRELLSERGSIYVHLDWHVGHYAKAVLDEVFGSDRFVNEIVWKRSNPHNDTRRYGSIHDVLLFYTKSTDYNFNVQLEPPSDEYLRSRFTTTDPDGRRYTLMPLMASGPGPARRFGDRVLNPPKGTHWRWTQERIDAAMESGLIVFTSGGTPRYKFYAEQSKGRPLQSLWTDLVPVNSQSAERLDYPTQKPEGLLERIIMASSDAGDLVLDCFAGSGTTAAVAERLGRRWLTCDLGRFAIHTTRKRLLGVPNVRPFVVQNLGKYERQAWQAAEFNGNAEARMREYRGFLLQLYGAQPVSGYVWLHGLKHGRMVHVGGVDAPVSTGDVTQIATEFRRAIGSGANAPTHKSVDVLGWDFAFELNEVAKQQAALAGIDVRFIRIPREVLEKKAVEQGDIRFFELAALSVDVKPNGKGVALELRDFVIPLDDVPEDVQRAITHWEQWIDYWAVDWDNRGDAFHNEWQTYRTRKDKTLERKVAHTYAEPGTYNIVVKVIDNLGNDTTKTLQVEVH